MWAHVWITAGIAVCGGIIFYSTSGALAGRVWELTNALLLVNMAIGISRIPAGRRRPWIAIWAGLAAAFAGGYLGAHPDLAPFDVSSPGIIDLLKLMNYPLGAAGVLTLIFRSDIRVGRRAAVEVLMAAGAGSVLIWVAVAEPIYHDTALTNGARAVALAYPLMDVLLLSVIAVLAVHISFRPGSMLFIAIGLTGNLVADIAFGYQSLQGTYVPGGLVDLGWLLCFSALSMAPWWPRSDKLEIVGDDGSLSIARFGFVLASALLVPGIVLAHAANNTPTSYVVAAAGVALIAVSFIRLGLFNNDLRRSRSESRALADRLENSNRELREARADQRALLDRVSRIAEEERTKIAADLHDRPLQHLAGVGYQLERISMNLAKNDVAVAAAVCEQASAGLATQLHELRTLMTEIRPPVLDQQGLVGALEDSAAQFSREHPDITFSATGHCTGLPADSETTLYRAVQEAARNVVKHADASIVTFEVGETCSDLGEELVNVVVSDNGCGFDASNLGALVRSGRFGVAGMSERIALAGGSVDITSSPAGTKVSFAVPKAQHRLSVDDLLAESIGAHT